MEYKRNVIAVRSHVLVANIVSVGCLRIGLIARFRNFSVLTSVPTAPTGRSE